MRLPTTTQCLKLRPNFSNAYNNRGVIYLRRADFDRALEEFNAAIKIASNNPTRALHLYNRARAQTYRKQYRFRACRFRRGRKAQPR